MFTVSLVATATIRYGFCVGHGRRSMWELPLRVWLREEVQPSYTTFVRACAYTAMLDTTVAGTGARVHLSSDYLGDPERRTRSTHYAESPDFTPVYMDWETLTHPVAELDVRWTPSECLYDHLQRLLALLGRVGEGARIEVSDETVRPFGELAHGRLSVQKRSLAPVSRSDFAGLLGVWAPLGPAR